MRPVGTPIISLLTQKFSKFFGVQQPQKTPKNPKKLAKHENLQTPEQQVKFAKL
jgi:hypothetical protein